MAKVGKMANRRILWVDEDFFFLEYVQQALEYLGHQPLLATHDSEAWRIFQKDSQAIDLVVLETTRADSCRQDLYRNLFQLNPNLRALLITSPGPQEGKSTTLTNLAVIMAQAGMKTLIMSCNLRHPSIYKIFGIKKKPGITDILSGGLNWKDVLQDPGIDNLKILSSGPYPPAPSELLSSIEFDNLIEETEKEYDIILFDSPPILPVTDAAVVASKVDGVVIVYFVGKAAREALMRSKTQLENVDSNIIGIILNDIKAEGKLAYTYYYHYQYKYYGVRDAKESAL